MLSVLIGLMGSGCAIMHLGSIQPGTLTSTSTPAKVIELKYKLVHGAAGHSTVTAYDKETDESYQGDLQWTFHGLQSTGSMLMLTGNKGTTIMGMLTLHPTPLYHRGYIVGEGSAMDNHNVGYRAVLTFK